MSKRGWSQVVNITNPFAVALFICVHVRFKGKETFRLPPLYNTAFSVPRYWGSRLRESSFVITAVLVVVQFPGRTKFDCLSNQGCLLLRPRNGKSHKLYRRFPRALFGGIHIFGAVRGPATVFSSELLRDLGLLPQAGV